MSSEEEGQGSGEKCPRGSGQAACGGSRGPLALSSSSARHTPYILSHEHAEDEEASHQTARLKSMCVPEEVRSALPSLSNALTFHPPQNKMTLKSSRESRPKKPCG